MMKAKELREKSVEELKERLVNLRKKIVETRFDLKLGKLKNVREIRNLKKEIARILTILREKGIKI